MSHPETEKADTNRGLAFFLCDNDFNRLHSAFMLAASALAMNRKVILFATGLGTKALCREDRFDAAWQTAEEVLTGQGIATMATLREMIVAMHADLLVCETGLRRTGLKAEDMVEGVKIVGIPTFLDLSHDYKVITF